VAERLLEVTAQPGGHREVVEALRLLALAPERETHETLRLVELGIDRYGALELLERRRIVLRVGQRLAQLQMRERVVRLLGQPAAERRLRRPRRPVRVARRRRRA